MVARTGPEGIRHTPAPRPLADALPRAAERVGRLGRRPGLRPARRAPPPQGPRAPPPGSVRAALRRGAAGPVRPGRYAAADGSFGRSAGSALGRGVLLLAVALVIGIVLLNAT